MNKYPVSTDQGRVLVVGATGRVGEPVARELLQSGHTVRVLVRQLNRARTQLGGDFEYVEGDITDPAAVERALEGVNFVHLSVAAGSDPSQLESVEHRGTARVAEVARRQGVSRLTYVSGLFAVEQFRHVPQHRAKIDAEQAIQQSGVPFTIFRPTYFMETLLSHIQNQRATIFGKGTRPFRMLAATDFAKLVARSLKTEAAANRWFTVFGPEAISLGDAFALHKSVAAPDLKLAPTPYWMMALINRFLLKGRLTRPLEIMELMDKVGEIGDSAETESVLGKPATTLRQWCEARRARVF